MQIFPLSLHELLALNDQVQQFSIELDGIRTCHGCGRKAASLKRCGKCSSFWYCDTVRPPFKCSPYYVNLFANMGAIRSVRELAGPKKATRLTASSSKIPICEDCLFSNGTCLITMFNFLSALQSTPRSEYSLLSLGWVHCAREEHAWRWVRAWSMLSFADLRSLVFHSLIQLPQPAAASLLPCCSTNTVRRGSSCVWRIDRWLISLNEFLDRLRACGLRLLNEKIHQW